MAHKHMQLGDITKQVMNEMNFHDVIHAEAEGPQEIRYHQFSIIAVNGGWLYVFYGGGVAFVPKSSGGGPP